MQPPNQRLILLLLFLKALNLGSLYFLFANMQPPNPRLILLLLFLKAPC